MGARGHCLVAAHFAREEFDPWYSGQSSLGQCCPGLNRSWKGFRSTEGTVQNWLLNTIQKHVRPTLKLTWYLSPLSDTFFSFRSRSIEIWSFLSSPRAEIARAVTGRRCPHSGEGEDFLTGQLNYFMETAVTPERKFEKSIPRWEN